MPAAGHIFTPPQAEEVAAAAEDHINRALNRTRMALAAD
jgi:hypothetical protein